jgi:ATP-binding cassette subfamily B protein
MNKTNYFFIIKNIIKNLSYRRKITVLIFLFFSTISGFFEFVSIAMLIPFMTLIVNPEKAQNYISKFIYFKDYALLNSSSSKILIGVSFVSLIIISGLIRVFLFQFGQRITNFINHEYNILIYKKVLSINNSSIKNFDENYLLTAFQKVNNLSSFFFSFISIFSNFIIFTFIFITVFILTPGEFFFLIGIFLIIYYLIIINFKVILLKNSKTSSEFYLKKNSLIINTIGLHKELILNNLKKYFLNNFSKYDYSLAKIQIINNSIAFLPGIILVNFAIIILATFILFLSINNNVIEYIPTISAIIFGTQKLIPLLQLIYTSTSKMKENYHQTKSLISYFNNQRVVNKENNYDGNKLLFKKKIFFKGISFKHSNKSDYIFKNLDFLIEKKDKILITGKSGIGKSSLLNILLGLLDPTSGEIFIDDKKIRIKNYSKFQYNFSYCPQSVYLINDTIVNNLTLPFDNKKIDNKRIVISSKISNIYNYILSQPKKYQSIINHGARNISGGQAQRIGIARTLYKDCEIYIFDESTNAIDNKTEKRILINLMKYLKEKTVIFISHKTNNINYFNKAYILKDKRLYATKKNTNN